MCDHELYSQCETTQNREYGTGASLLGYSKLYGQVPGGQAEFLHVPFADFMPIKVPEGPPDDRFVFLSDVLPTAWQAVQYAAVPEGGTLLVMGLGPIGDMSARIALHLGCQVIGVDLVPERLARVAGRGAEVIDLTAVDDVGDAVRERTGGRGADADPMPMLTLFDKQLQVRMGQANVKRWVDDIMPLLTDDSDPLGSSSSRPTGCLSRMRRRRTRSSRRRPTARSRSSSGPDRGTTSWRPPSAPSRRPRSWCGRCCPAGGSARSGSSEHRGCAMSTGPGRRSAPTSTARARGHCSSTTASRW
jgi:hypothetical protein